MTSTHSLIGWHGKGLTLIGCAWHAGLPCLPGILSIPSRRAAAPERGCQGDGADSSLLLLLLLMEIWVGFGCGRAVSQPGWQRPQRLGKDPQASLSWGWDGMGRNGTGWRGQDRTLLPGHRTRVRSTGIPADAAPEGRGGYGYPKSLRRLRPLSPAVLCLWQREGRARGGTAGLSPPRGKSASPPLQELPPPASPTGQGPRERLSPAFLQLSWECSLISV